MEVDKRSIMPCDVQPGHVGEGGSCLGRYEVTYSRKEEPNPMAPMGVSPPIALTKHGGVQPVGLHIVSARQIVNLSLPG